MFWEEILDSLKILRYWTGRCPWNNAARSSMQEMTTSASLRAGLEGISKNAVCESREFLSTTSESPLMTAESANLGLLDQD